MVRSLNKVQLIGNVGMEPRITTFSSGGRAANFTLATSESWKDKQSGEQKERTEWHNVVVYNTGLVSIVESYVKKGSKLYIEGQIQTRKYTDKDGVEKFMTEIVLQNFSGEMLLLDSKNGSGDGGSNKISAPSSKEKGDFDDKFANDDDIPF
ncbi:MAG: single-stranded DNA-binding protein [Rickettsiales bacterium]|jgi:single-strand DNA-binding protein|nr:single-stranded DNA-binding protein [Rickettsiales bacterium]